MHDEDNWGMAWYRKAKELEVEVATLRKRINDLIVRREELWQAAALGLQWLDEVTNADNEDLRTEEGMDARKSISQALMGESR